ncbi:uncharacterized protein LOC122244849, partial [Penaeus japonicus]|uniref:uncharacterized protein LOC122244849 n=1 Tax=Penaeus japonicus TaxID=27405 RepID=UPI001C715F7E
QLHQDAWGGPRRLTYSTVLKETWSSFWTRTSISGISNAGNAHHSVARILWLGLTVVGLYFTTRDAVAVVQEYLKYPYTTQVNLLHKTQVEFPAMTVCNQNRVSCRKLLREMITQVSTSAESDETLVLVELYNLSRCGVDSLSCNTVRDEYYEYYESRSEVIPAIHYEKDICLECPSILNDYMTMCYEAYETNPANDFLWKMGDCFANAHKYTSAYNEFPYINEIIDIILKESIEECPCINRHGDVIECPEEGEHGQEMGGRDKGPKSQENQPTESASSSSVALTPSYDDETTERSVPATDASPSVTADRKGPGRQFPNEADATTSSSDVTSSHASETSVTTPSNDVTSSRASETSVTTPSNDVTSSRASETSVTTPSNDVTSSRASETSVTTPSNDVTSSRVSEISVTTPSKEITSSRVSGTRPLRRKRRQVPPLRDYNDYEEYEDLFETYKEMATSERHDLQMNFLSLYMDMPQEMKKDIGYDFNELIKDCDFLGRKCNNESNFHHHLSPTFGNCYIFNGAGGVYTSLTGPTFSLSLVIDTLGKTYLPRRLTQKSGARVAVHRPNTLPLLDDDAIDVGPEKASSIAIKELNLHRLQHPYEANCTSSWIDTHYRYINRTYANVYTITECLRMCLQRLFVERCSCFHALYPDNFLYNGKQYIRDTSTCNLTSKNPNSACVEKSLKLYSSNPEAAECGCNVACNETQYPNSLSMASWPPEASEADVKMEYGKDNMDDMMRVDVFFHTLNVDDVTQIGKYENAWGLVSSLGGALSLYMGISVILLVEVIEFFIYLVVNSCLYVAGRYDSKTEVRPVTPPSPTPSDVVFVRRLYDALGTKVKGPKSY